MEEVKKEEVVETRPLNFLEEIMGCFHFSTPALQMALEEITAQLLENPQIESDALWNALGSVQQSLLLPSIQKLKKITLSDDQIQSSINHLLLSTKRHLLLEEINEKTKEYLSTERPELKAELDALRKEVEILNKNE